MDSIDTREWLLTNGLGGFASGTVCDAHTRTYHGWLIAALEPPGQRTLLLSRIDATLEVSGQSFELGTNIWVSGTIAPLGYKRLHSFQTNPTPHWVWSHPDWQFSREILLPHGLSSLTEDTTPHCCNRVLIRYRYDGQEAAVLKLRPLIGDRNFHAQQHADPDLQFSQVIEPQRIHLQAMRRDWIGTLWQLAWTQGEYHPDAVWYWSYRYPEETQRGLGDQEDLFSPGYLTVRLQPGESVTLEGRVEPPAAIHYPLPDRHSFDHALQLEQQRLSDRLTPALEQFALKHPHKPEKMAMLRQLLQAGDQFITYRASINGPTVIAGYHWFNDWGRDTLIALPGLALTTQQFSLAKGLLETFGKYCQDGLIPNTFPDAGSDPAYNSLDAVLWWIETLGLYLEATQDWDFLQEQYPIVRRIYKSFMAGTSYHIRIDAFDGLVTWEFPGVALTWMDALVDGQPVTPRQGKPIEINALWYSALCWAQQWAERLQQMSQDEDEILKLGNQARRYAQQAEQVKASLQKFWNAEYSYFYDRIEPNDCPDGSIRPNAVIALSLYHCGFSTQQAQQGLQIARDRLLTPYGLRSLDPFHPAYIGRYAGNSRHRDRAYHQGTVWSWLIGPFIRAWKRFYPADPLPWRSDRLLDHLQHQVGLGTISEIFDGDFPHTAQGAIAQAWSVAELIRHWNDI
ncbi:glycogen debranching enzyme family protein [Oscillatoria sp. FACHB-1407]|uniref:amylo-alpha-1,6-glucosidase n=1 Tax=Oscillatoria sp. FACHB-1407 TaxID=2692847 RepID=UPI001685EC6C|nr:amylo-alpha-1,6-glucosidase [Oscillatoria sp. FACHB-1407]MBD2461686.1 glycogen debranching enzyme family protein [Oscillatoria sp. FACHB-1407]